MKWEARRRSRSHGAPAGAPSRLRAWVDDERGQSLALFALALPALLVAAGLVLNTGLALRQKLVLQGAVDAAALAAAGAYDRREWEECRVFIDEGLAYSLAGDYLRRNMADARLELVTTDNDPGGARAAVSVTGAADVPVSMPRLFGTGRVTVRSTTRTVRTNAECRPPEPGA